jgi:FAD/FMN-containing dehydrogenase
MVSSLSVFTALAAGALVACSGSSAPPVAPAPAGPIQWCHPNQPCWPAEKDWQALAGQLKGKLEQPKSPLAACEGGPSEACAAAIRAATNPFFLEDQVGGTQQAGYLDAWEPKLSVYAIVAETAEDIAAGVKFAAAHQLRLAIKGTGHDYLGRSSAADSLLIWTHHMRKVEVVDAFVPHGCPASTAAVPAVNVEAGARWLEAYQAVTVEHGRYVQGGGCTSVGAAGGFLQGGGFGSWSKKYGTGAAGLVEAEVITADGQKLIANACQHSDLLWALRGGGGGTFGVVSKVTLLTHPLPTSFGSVQGKIAAPSDAAFRDLLGHFIALYRDQLNNEHWGESVNLTTHNELEISMAFQGLSETEAAAVWQPLRTWIGSQPGFKIEFAAHALPATKMWSYDFFHQYAPDAIKTDDRPDAQHGQFWWSGDAEQVHTYWYTYESRWLPLDLFQPAQADKLADALFAASRHWWSTIHFNKGLAGASADAVARTRDTATNPAVLTSAALFLTGAVGDAIPGIPGHDVDRAKATERKAKATAAMQAIRDVTPNAGSYVNETSYFELDWQHAFWGDNYEKLLAIKRTYDPRGLFMCHHCVGSEASGL